MFFFLMAVLSSAMVSICMRLSGKYTRNNLSMLACNYLMCSVLSLIFTPQATLFPAADGIGRTAFLGIINGIFYLSSFVVFNVSIRRSGVVLSTTFMKLGVIVPTIMSMLFFHETPTLVQLIGIAAALFAIVLIHSEKGTRLLHGCAGLVLLALLSGMASSMSKIYEVCGSEPLSDYFLLYTFFVALLLCVAMAIGKRQSLSLPDVLFGFLIGLPNYFSARFMLKALEVIPAIIAYPAYSVAAIVLVTTAGIVFFKEKLTRRQTGALVIIMAALALLNL